MAADVAEQPELYATMLDDGLESIAAVARRIAAAPPRQVMFVARGTSHHAALYGMYLAEIRLGLPVSLASPSVITRYEARLELPDCLVIGVSQSGASTDLIEVVSMARECGASTVAVTNTPGSPLTEVAELHIDLNCGVERAVAATKTYTSELLALLLLIEAVRAGGELPRDERAALGRLPELARTVLADPAAAEIASRYRFATRLITTGRGYAYPTAREAALKLMETSYVAALAFSGADLLHGPVAVVDSGVPVLAVVGTGPGGQSMNDVLDRLVERRADLLTIGSGPARGELSIVTPDVDERYAPLLDILPLQRLALQLALARGEDPDAPRGLHKVTATR